jgi:O-antigen/teichoic acid export membrane protein
LRVLASLLFTVVIALLIPPLLSWLHQANHIGLMQRSLLLIALYRVMDYFKSLFEALHRLRSTFIINTVEHSLKLILVLLLYRGGNEFFTIVTAFTVAVAVALAVGFVLTIQRIPGMFVPRQAWPNIRQLYLYSLPVFLMSIAGFISPEIDTIMLKNLATDYETGIYSAAKQIVIFLPHIALAFSMGIIPGISIFEEAAAPIQRRLYYRLLVTLAGLYVIVCLGVVMFARWGMGLFFRPEYHTASTTLLVLLPFVVFNAATIFSGNLMLYRGLAWQRLANVGVTITANVVLNWLLIPVWGAVGAAAASSLAYLPYCLLNLRAADKAFSASRA